jgi:hypothetical protein
MMSSEPPILVEVKTSGRHVRDVIGAWSWGHPPRGDAALAMTVWVERCAQAARLDGVAVIIRRSP